KARLAWSADPESAAKGWRANLHLESTGLVSKLFRVNDDYQTQLRSDLCTLNSYINAQEGRRHRETKVAFDLAARKASRTETDLIKKTELDKSEIDIPSCVHDVIGGLYFLRTLRLQPDDHTEIPVSDGKKSVSARVDAQQREQVKTAAGTFQTIRYEVFLFNNVLYRRSGRLYVWLTDDERRLPVQIRVRLQFTIGTITLQLEKIEREAAFSKTVQSCSWHTMSGDVEKAPAQS